MVSHFDTVKKLMDDPGCRSMLLSCLTLLCLIGSRMDIEVPQRPGVIVPSSVPLNLFIKKRTHQCASCALHHTEKTELARDFSYSLFAFWGPRHRAIETKSTAIT